jgi:hypothetical protein
LPELSLGLVNFLFGCAGGFGVTLYSLHEASKQPKEMRPSFDAVYFGQAVGMIVLGGIVALANHLTKPVSPLTAFNVGLSLPAIIKIEADRRSRKPRAKRID